jgi:hypothetical protein
MNYIATLAAARGTLAAAREELRLAELHVQPLRPDLLELFQTKPDVFKTYQERVAAIEATLPALRSAVATAEVALEPLQAKACWKCDGTGRYNAPTRAMRKGVPYCFKCDGHGTLSR